MTVAELAEQFELHPDQIIRFRQHAGENVAGLFAKEGAAKPLGPSEADLKVLHACNDPPVFAQIMLLSSMIDRFVPVFSCQGLDEAGVGCKTQSSH